jgi:arylsulfatase A-like enzyme
MPLIIAGPGVKRGVVFDYAEQIDIVPTLSYLTRVKGPANADGIILAEALEHPPAQAAARKLSIAQFNRQLLAGNALIAHVRERVKSEYHLQGALRAAEEAFQDVDRILEWHKFGSLERLSAVNQEAIDRLKKATMP